MNQAALYAALQEAGCTVISFEDQPQFFGNWLAHFKRGQQVFAVVSDNREGWLTLWRRSDSGTGERLHEVRSTTFDEATELHMLKNWVADLHG